ncbi:MAG: thioredoxin domain-containing protein [Actinobacteria bacterium]|nr:thioredoxin domain-containing protein [Actinomycetota bacterium]
MAKSSAAKEKAAAARKAAEASDKRRQRTINIIIGVVLVVVVVGLIVGAYFVAQGNKDQANADPDAAVPTGTLPASDEYAYGVDVAGAAPGKPILEIWEDFQCPACGQFEAAFGTTVEEIAESGDARVIWRSTSFLDSQFPGQNSQRAAAAWGCAIDAGQKVAYHDTVFANQPATEGQGWTQEQLISFGSQAGIGDDKIGAFESCVNDKTYMPWSANSTQIFMDDQIGGTPTLLLNGEKVSNDALANPEALKNAVKEAAQNTKN